LASLFLQAAHRNAVALASVSSAMSSSGTKGHANDDAVGHNPGPTNTRLKIRHCLAFVGALLIFATVYLRYHYFIDIIAGVLLAFPCLLTTDRLFAIFRTVPSRSLTED